MAHENRLGNPAKLSVILWGDHFLFPTCCPAFQSNSINDTGDGGRLVAAHIACNVFSLLSSSMKRENETFETFSHFIETFCSSHDCFIP